MSRSDLLRSWLRTTALKAREGLERLPGSGAVRRAFAEGALGRAALPDAELTGALARVPGVRAVTVSCDERQIKLHASYEDGHELSLSLWPVSVKFAPAGAKEIAFAVEPPEAAASARAHDLVGALAGAIARRLWAPALGKRASDPQIALVTRDGARLVIDLRSVPAVRAALSKAMAAAMIEALSLQRLSLERGKLTLRVALPPLR